MEPTNNQKKKWVIIGGLIVIAVIIILAQSYRSFLGARIPAVPELSESIVGGRLKAETFQEGSNTIEFSAKTDDGRTVSDAVTFDVIPPTPDNDSPPLHVEFERDGRKISIDSPHSELIPGQTQRFTATYSINHWPGTYQGEMNIFIEGNEQSEFSNFSPTISNQRWLGDPQYELELDWPYSIQNGNSASFSFDMKVPEKGYANRDFVSIHAQNLDTFGPQYLNQDGTAPEGPITVSVAEKATFPIR